MGGAALARSNVVEHGDPAGRPMLFVHGFGCDQGMWREVWPAFAADRRILLMDHVGHGGADAAAFDPRRHGSLTGFAQDVLDVVRELDLRDIVFVGHSVSAMIGMLAAIEEPDRFDRLVLIGPSPRYIDDEGYRGGFTREDIEGLLDSMDSNYLGWARAMAPVIAGNEDRPAVGQELSDAFCRADPDIARAFARVTFLSDNREDLGRVSVPCLVIQCSRDVIAPEEVGRFVHDALPQSTFVQLAATGHCPNLSAPEETVEAIRSFVS